MKVCCVCKEQKELTEFYRNAQHIDGLNYHCKACDNERARRYRGASPTYKAKDSKRAIAYQKRNPDKAKAKYKRYRENHREKKSASIRLWEIRNHDRRMANQRAWRGNNKEKAAFSAYKRRTLEQSAGGYFDAVSLMARFSMFGGNCWICNKTANRTDHVKPLCKGGTNWPGNLRPICVPCNSAKSGKWNGVAGLRAITERIKSRMAWKSQQAGAKLVPTDAD